MSENTITIVGNLTDDPELRFTPSGDAVANFTVASTPRRFDRQANEWTDGDTMYLDASAWRGMAENVAETLVRGARVIVTGSLKVRYWEDKDGNKRTSYELDVTEVGASLRFDSYTRQQRAKQADTRQTDRQPATRRGRK